MTSKSSDTFNVNFLVQRFSLRIWNKPTYKGKTHLLVPMVNLIQNKIVQSEQEISYKELQQSSVHSFYWKIGKQ